MIEFKKLTQKQKENLINFVKCKCEICGKERNEIVKLEIHRPRQGMPYSLNNSQVVCKYKGKIENRYSCHDILNSAQNRAGGFYNGK